jgi:hypothetical protein
MKRLRLLITVLGSLVVLATPLSALAVDVLNPACTTDANSTLCRSNTNQELNGNSLYGPNGVLTRAASMFAVIVGVAAVIMILVGGFKYVTSLGDPSNIKSAKDTIMYAIVGIIVAITAQSIVLLVLRRL